MALLLQASYLEELTGQESDLFPHSILELAEARAKALLGYLAVETKMKTFYLFQQTKLLNMDVSNASISKIEYRTDNGDYTELIVDEDVSTYEYKYITDKGLIVLETPLVEDTEVKVTYSIGWTAMTLPAVVKFLIALIAIDTLNKFKPGTINTSAIDTTKIGDYMVKYRVSGTSDSSMSFDSVVDQLVLLIQQGTSEPHSTI